MQRVAVFVCLSLSAMARPREALSLKAEADADLPDQRHLVDIISLPGRHLVVSTKLSGRHLVDTLSLPPGRRHQVAPPVLFLPFSSHNRSCIGPCHFEGQSYSCPVNETTWEPCSSQPGFNVYGGACFSPEGRIEPEQCQFYSNNPFNGTFMCPIDRRGILEECGPWYNIKS